MRRLNQPSHLDVCCLQKPLLSPVAVKELTHKPKTCMQIICTEKSPGISPNSQTESMAQTSLEPWKFVVDMEPLRVNHSIRSGGK